jgi:hypothetical protein
MRTNRARSWTTHQTIAHDGDAPGKQREYDDESNKPQIHATSAADPMLRRSSVKMLYGFGRAGLAES